MFRPPLFLHGCFVAIVLAWSLDPAAVAAPAADTAEKPFQLTAGEFPPEGSARHIAGELIALDYINRTGVLRVDRTDAQHRGDWDLPLPFTMLPYGSLRYHGAPAELRDIPIGTHLHGQFYEGEKPVPDKTRRLAGEAIYNRVLRLEDDFSYDAREQRSWKVEAVDLDKGTLTVLGSQAGQADPKPTVFQILPSTRVWKGRGFATPFDLKPEQTITLNLTVCTLKGPGRCTDIWLDDESRSVASANQAAVHRQFIHEHGLAAVVDSVDNEKGTMIVTLFAGFDPALLNDFPSATAIAAAAKAPPFVPVPGLVDPIAVTAAVAEDTLRTWDQINDRKGGTMIEQLKTTPAPGNSGIQIKFKPSLLLEGFRPKRIIRLWCSAWRVDDLPREEHFNQ
jgi:hypothetical protein